MTEKLFLEVPIKKPSGQEGFQLECIFLFFHQLAGKRFVVNYGPQQVRTF
jgi:hypothetical protein